MKADITDNPPNCWISDGQLTVAPQAPVESIVQSSRQVKTVQSVYTSPQLDFRHRIAFDLASIPEVEAVFTSEYGRVFFVWTVVKERSQEVYQQLYKKEQELIEANQPVQFDFTILASRGYDPKTVITDPLAQIAYARS
jgi:hypothetical protein